MSPIDLAPPAIIAPSPTLWRPAKPFIVRASEDDDNAVKAMPFLAAIAGGARRANVVTKTFINTGRSSADATTYDFGNFTMPVNGLMVVGVLSRNSASTARTLSSVSIGGTNGTIHTQVSAGGNTAGIASRAVSAGAQNVTVTHSGATNRCSIFVWALEHYRSATPHDQGSTNAASASSLGLTLNYPIRGVGLYVTFNSSATSITWSGATEETEFTEELRIAGAFKYMQGGATGNVETASYDATNQSAIAGATWG